MLSYKCLMMHSSKSPRHEGGCPLQNQITRGVQKSAATIFDLNNALDGSIIHKQFELSLDDNISHILKRIETVGVVATKQILAGDSRTKAQNQSEFTEYKRRTPIKSEIIIEEVILCFAEYLFAKIRMLTDSCSNAFICVGGGNRFLVNASRDRGL